MYDTEAPAKAVRAVFAPHLDPIPSLPGQPHSGPPQFTKVSRGMDDGLHLSESEHTLPMEIIYEVSLTVGFQFHRRPHA